MEEQEFISLEILCEHYQVEVSFINSLNELNLIEINQLSDEISFPSNQLGELEKFIRFHKDLEINIEGIDVISRLLNQMNTMNKEIQELKDKLEYINLIQ